MNNYLGFYAGSSIENAMDDTLYRPIHKALFYYRGAEISNQMSVRPLYPSLDALVHSASRIDSLSHAWDRICNQVEEALKNG